MGEDDRKTRSRLSGIGDKLNQSTDADVVDVDEDEFETADVQEASGASDTSHDSYDSRDSHTSQESSSSSSSTSTSASTVSGDDAEGPAFEFDDDHRRSIYPRPESWEAFEDAVAFDVERVLREHDVRDSTGRELHDALVRLGAEQPEEIARLLLAERGIDVETER